VPGQHRDVEARRRLFDHLEVAAIALPSGQRRVPEKDAEVLAHRWVRSRTHPAVADHLRGDALHQLEIHRGRGQHREVVMAVNVDEAGRERKAACVDLEHRRALDFAYRRDSIAAHGNAALKRRSASAVEDPCAANDDVPVIGVHIDSYSRVIRAGETAASVTPCAARSGGTPRPSARLAQSRPIEGEVSIPYPPWPASQKNPATRGS